MLLDRGAVRPRRSGGAAARGGARLRLVLVAVPPRLHAAAAVFLLGAVLRPARLPAARGRGADPADRAWRRARAGAGCCSGKASSIVWLAFVGVAAGAAALGWGLTSLLLFRLLPLGRGVPVRAVARRSIPRSRRCSSARTARSPTRSAPDMRRETQRTRRLHPPRPAPDGRPGRGARPARAKLYQAQVVEGPATPRSPRRTASAPGWSPRRAAASSTGSARWWRATS